MPSLELRGTVTEVKEIPIYFDGDEYPGAFVTIKQDGYDEFASQAGWIYYPPRVRGTLKKMGGKLPEVGSKVVALVSTGTWEKDGKVNVNLNLRKIELVK